MKILYVTDLHGDQNKYHRVYEIARAQKVKAVVNGGDILCRDEPLHESQKIFIENFLDNHFSAYEKAGIYYLGYLGNDDLKTHDDLFSKICSKYPHVIDMAQNKFKIGQFEFIGMNWVVDYPFRLKDRCRKDHQDYIFQTQFGPGLLSTDNGFENLEDWFSYASTLPTIEDELMRLPLPQTPQKTIYLIHMPPAKVGLDVCMHGACVGSQSVYEFIKKTQPLLTLHGHIHESPQCSGVWKTKIGKTICIQPGQMETNLTHVIIDFSTMKVKMVEESLCT